MPATLPYIGCSIKKLPDHQVVAAAQTAVRINPANRPRRDPSVPAVAQRIALLTSTYWGPKGVDLTVQFVDLNLSQSRDASLANKILLHANAWGTKANVRFRLTTGQGQVRITRRAGDGYWSYLGTDILHIPANEPTLNLDSFTLNTPDSEFYRVVRHEVGHTMGFPHEHMRQEIVADIDQNKAIAYFGRTQGWSAQEVQQQVLTPLQQGDLRFDDPPDRVSIMCYALPASIMKSGVAVPGGTDIDATDYKLAADIYPQAVVVPPVSPPPPVVVPPVSPPPPPVVITQPGSVVLDLGAKVATLPAGWAAKVGG